MTSRKIKLKNRIEWRNKEGKLHRVDGPAVEFAIGTKRWHHNGILHRVGGPAVEWSDGSVEWYLNARYFSSQEEWFNALSKEDQVNYLFKMEGSK